MGETYILVYSKFVQGIFLVAQPQFVLLERVRCKVEITQVSIRGKLKD